MATSAQTWESWRTAIRLDYETFGNCVQTWTYYLIHLNKAKAAEWWGYVVLAAKVIMERLVVGFGYIASDAEGYADSLVTPIEDWVNDLVSPIKNAVNGFYADIHDLWTSIGQLWGRPVGATLAWVLNQLAILKDWVNAEYAGAKTKAIASWDWIQNEKALIDKWFAAKSAEIASWFDTKSAALYTYMDSLFAPLQAWWETQRAKLDALTTERINQIIIFLEDPGKFIAGYVLDWLEWIIGSAVWRFW